MIRASSRFRALLAAALLIASAAGLGGCAWFRTPVVPDADMPPLSTGREVLAQPASDGSPGRLHLLYRDGDFTAPDLILAAGHWDIEVFNFNNPRPIGFFLRLPDRYGRELEHLATGGGIAMGTGRTFRVTLTAGQTYFYSCPITDSPNHLMSAVAVPQRAGSTPAASSGAPTGPAHEQVESTSVESTSDGSTPAAEELP